MKPISRAIGILLFVLGSIVTPAGLAQENAAATKLLDEAKRLEQDGSFDKADDSYQVILERFAGTSQAQQATLALARSHVRGGRPNEASSTLDELIADHPESANAAAAAVYQGQIKRGMAQSIADLEEAQTLLSRIPLLYGAEKFATLDARVEARVRSGEVRLLLGLPELAALDFLQAIEDEPPSRWLSLARLGLAQSLLDQGGWGAAADVLQRVIDAGSAIDAGSEVDAGSEEAAVAARSLTFIHRRWLRPSLGQSPWATARVVDGVSWKKPSIVAASDDGQVMVFDQGQGLVVTFGPDGQVLSRSQSKDVRGLWWGRDGTPYRASAENARNFSGNVTQSFNRENAEKQHIAKNVVAGGRGLFGHWLVLDRGQSALMVFAERRGRFVKSVPAEDPADIALTHRSELLMLDRKAGEVNRLDLDFKKVGKVAGGWKRAERIASDPAGNLYVLNALENRIELFDRDGTKLEPIGPSLPGGFTLRDAADIAVDGEGRLYIVDIKLQQLIVLE